MGQAMFLEPNMKTKKCIICGNRLARQHLYCSLACRITANIVVAPNACHIWCGTLHQTGGYPRVRHNGKIRRTHRLAFEAWKGPIPHGLEIDHVCRQRTCVNPDHLEAVTKAVNLERADNNRRIVAMNIWRDRTHCAYGHPFSGANLGLHKNGVRYCKTCRAERDRARWKKKAASRRRE